MPKVWITLLATAVLGLSCRCGGNPSDQSSDPQRAADSQIIASADQRAADAESTATNDAPGAADAQTDRGTTDAGYAGCVRSCTVSAKTDCASKSKNCVARCEIALTSICGAEFRALTDCAATKNLDAYQCDDFGASMLRPGVCAEELTALTKCLTPK